MAISLLEEVKMQASVLVPLLRTLREELGTERADALVKRSLRDWLRSVYERIGQQVDEPPRDKWGKVFGELSQRVGDDVDFEMLAVEEDRLEYNVTACRFAQFFKELGEPDLGSVLVCEMDVHIAELGGNDVEFTRTQTIMQGADYCDFRYRLSRGDAED